MLIWRYLKYICICEAILFKYRNIYAISDICISNADISIKAVKVSLLKIEKR